jgi:hypothetical protein
MRTARPFHGVVTIPKTLKSPGQFAPNLAMAEQRR